MATVLLKQGYEQMINKNHGELTFCQLVRSKLAWCLVTYGDDATCNLVLTELTSAEPAERLTLAEYVVVRHPA